MLTLGWPMYLLFNSSGHKYPRWANHFDPYSPIFSKRERMDVLLSDMALFFVVGAGAGGRGAGGGGCAALCCAVLCCKPVVNPRGARERGQRA
jgi:hypothetical protein